MRKSLTIALLLLGALLFGAPAALADHMTGRYIGIGDLEGAIIDMQQSGRQVTGRISGTENGSIEARSDGGDSFSGMLWIENFGRLPFEGRWAPSGLTLTVTINGNRATMQLVPAGGRLDDHHTPTVDGAT